MVSAFLAIAYLFSILVDPAIVRAQELVSPT